MDIAVLGIDLGKTTCSVAGLGDDGKDGELEYLNILSTLLGKGTAGFSEKHYEALVSIQSVYRLRSTERTAMLGKP